jgi:hypothetical protein
MTLICSLILVYNILVLFLYVTDTSLFYFLTFLLKYWPMLNCAWRLFDIGHFTRKSQSSHLQHNSMSKFERHVHLRVVFSPINLALLVIHCWQQRRLSYFKMVCVHKTSLTPPELADILLKVVLNTITLTLCVYVRFCRSSLCLY